MFLNKVVCIPFWILFILFTFVSNHAMECFKGNCKFSSKNFVLKPILLNCPESDFKKSLFFNGKLKCSHTSLEKYMKKKFCLFVSKSVTSEGPTQHWSSPEGICIEHKCLYNNFQTSRLLSQSYSLEMHVFQLFNSRPKVLNILITGKNLWT